MTPTEQRAALSALVELQSALVVLWTRAYGGRRATSAEVAMFVATFHRALLAVLPLLDPTTRDALRALIEGYGLPSLTEN